MVVGGLVGARRLALALCAGAPPTAVQRPSRCARPFLGTRLPNSKGAFLDALAALFIRALNDDFLRPAVH